MRVARLIEESWGTRIGKYNRSEIVQFLLWVYISLPHSTELRGLQGYSAMEDKMKKWLLVGGAALLATGLVLGGYFHSKKATAKPVEEKKPEEKQIA